MENMKTMHVGGVLKTKLYISLPPFNCYGKPMNCRYWANTTYCLLFLLGEGYASESLVNNKKSVYCRAKRIKERTLREEMKTIKEKWILLFEVKRHLYSTKGCILLILKIVFLACCLSFYYKEFFSFFLLYFTIRSRKCFPDRNCLPLLSHVDHPGHCFFFQTFTLLFSPFWSNRCIACTFAKTSCPNRNFYS